jgi:uncharacterized iron-regulated protein
MNRLIFIFFIMFVIQSCATTPKTMMRKDPLIGKCINTKTNAQVDFDSFMEDISTYDVIYLSEKHNNPEHHHIQQKVIRSLIK